MLTRNWRAPLHTRAHAQGKRTLRVPCASQARPAPPPTTTSTRVRNTAPFISKLCPVFAGFERRLWSIAFVSCQLRLFRRAAQKQQCEAVSYSLRSAPSKAFHRTSPFRLASAHFCTAWHEVNYKLICITFETERPPCSYRQRCMRDAVVRYAKCAARIVRGV